MDDISLTIALVVKDFLHLVHKTLFERKNTSAKIRKAKLIVIFVPASFVSLLPLAISALHLID